MLKLEDTKILNQPKRLEEYAPIMGGIGNKKRGRPSTGFDKKDYMKEYMRKKRAEKKKNDHGSR